MAVLLGHNLILRLLSLENDYFNLGLIAEIEERTKAFPRIWDSQHSAAKNGECQT